MAEWEPGDELIDGLYRESVERGSVVGWQRALKAAVGSGVLVPRERLDRKGYWCKYHSPLSACACSDKEALYVIKEDDQ